MSFIKGNREQIGFIGYSIDDFVEKDSKARFIAKIVERIDTRNLYQRYSDQGGEAFDPKIMLATWFLGYCESVTTTRKLEYNCKKNLDFIYISANLQPDHTSLSRFRQKHLDLMPEYFVEIIKQAYKMGISEFKRVSIDGTKLRAVSSKKKSMKSESLEELIKLAEQDIADYMGELEEEEKREKKKEKLAKAEAELLKRKKELKKDYRDNHQVNIEEPEACMMDTGKNRESFPGYNAQVSTDTETQLIVSADVVQDRNDRRQFIRQCKNVEKNIGIRKERTYIGDGGYNSLNELEGLYSEEIDAYIAGNRKTKSSKEKIKEVKTFTRDDFTYDKESDCYICPKGNRLEHYKREENKHFKGNRYKAKDCLPCEFMKLCFAKNNTNGYRELRRDDREQYAEKMKEKMTTKIAKEMMYTRRTTVETVIGNLKSNMGYNRFRLKGLNKVNGEFKLMCIGHNLNKLYQYAQNNLWDPITGYLDIVYQKIRSLRKNDKVYKVKYIRFINLNEQTTIIGQSC
jgi:transposase